MKGNVIDRFQWLRDALDVHKVHNYKYDGHSRITVFYGRSTCTSVYGCRKWL